MDRVSKITDPEGGENTFTYDAQGRRSTAADPAGVVTQFGYDARGWETSRTRAGRTWQTAYDAEGGTASKTTPLGYATTYGRNARGEIASVTNGEGETALFERDAMGRITAVTDPLGATRTFEYDPRGFPAAAMLPDGTGIHCEYDGLARISRLTDAGGGDWTFERTAMGRLATLTDPLGNSLQVAYDERGRDSVTTYPDGGTLTRTYDGVGNVVRKLYSDGTDLSYIYDAADRLAGTNGLALTRNGLGKVTEAAVGGGTYGAAYDAAGRLTSLDYAGALTVTYGYDAETGLLARVSDDLAGGWVEIDRDGDLRLTGIRRSNGVDAAFTLDGADRVARIVDGQVLDIAYTYDGAGKVTGRTATVPLAASELLGSSEEIYAYDAASGLSGPGYAVDSRGRLTAAPGHALAWDGASRLVGVDGVRFAYDGLGNPLSRVEGTTATEYAHHQGLGLDPLVAEFDGAAKAPLRYYVWTPDGMLLYEIEAGAGTGIRFYHFDAAGNTLALTDAAGTVTDAYAYTPFGRLLAHQGNSGQPFTFAGKWGVRREGAGGDLYHMRARWYDAGAARFLSREPLWPSPSSPERCNPYQYALNDPLTGTDPTGEGKFGELGGTFAGELLNLPDAPTSPLSALWLFLKGTPTGYENDPEWGYGSQELGFMTKERRQKYDREQEEFRYQESKRRQAENLERLKREHEAYINSPEHQEWVRRNNRRNARDAQLLANAEARGAAEQDLRRKAKQGVWVKFHGNDQPFFFEGANLIRHWDTLDKAVLNVGDEEIGPLWLENVKSAQEGYNF